MMGQSFPRKTYCKCASAFVPLVLCVLIFIPLKSDAQRRHRYRSPRTTRDSLGIEHSSRPERTWAFFGMHSRASLSELPELIVDSRKGDVRIGHFASDSELL